MATYIDDTGSNGYDASLSGNFTTDAANKTLTMGNTAEASSSFILPSSTAWLLVETYDVENVSGDLGYHKWQSDVSTIGATLIALRAIVDAEYTNYKMKATHYLGNGLADVYEANDTTAFPTTANNEDIIYTPSASAWIISDTVIAPEHADFTVSFSGVANITDETAHEITMTFSEAPKAATMTTTNITQQVQDNGTISNIAVTGDTKIWTFDFTADASITDTTNTYRAGTGILTNVGDRALTTQTDSSNFTIDNASETVYETFYVSLGLGTGGLQTADSGDSYVGLDTHNSSTDVENLYNDGGTLMTGQTVSQTAIFYWHLEDGRDSGSNTYALPDDIMVNSFAAQTGGYEGVIELDLLASTDYRLTVSGSSATTTGDSTDVDIDGTTKTLADGYATPPSFNTWDVTTDSTPSPIVITVSETTGSTYGTISGIKVERLSN